MPHRLFATIATFAVAAGLCVAGDDTGEKKESRWPHVRLGGIYVNAGYAHYSGSPYGWYGMPWAYGGPFWGYPGYYYDPFFYYPWIHPGWVTGFAYAPGMGEIKLQTPDKTALVYVDGGFAGYSGKLKNMWLQPGAYKLEVRSGDRTFEQKVYVLSGKTLTLDARATADDKEQRP